MSRRIEIDETRIKYASKTKWKTDADRFFISIRDVAKRISLIIIAADIHSVPFPPLIHNRAFRVKNL